MTKYVIAIGDIHGQLEKLTMLLSVLTREKIESGEYQLVFLGDYIDRGENSCKVVEFVRTLQAHGAICLMGNHEQIAFADGAPYDLQTLNSYGGIEESAKVGSRWHQDLEWFRSLPVCYETEKHFFVHAGIDPRTPLSEQTSDTMLWIRDRFLNYNDPMEKYIVHGHTPARGGSPDVRHNRCNLDSGAGYEKFLSAAIFDLQKDQPVHIISV